LSEVKREVEHVSRLFPADSTRVRTNPDTVSLLDEIERCSTLHWCTHGVFRQDNPGFSSLATGDGSIYLSDLAERNLQAQLVVLSACESGRVFLGRGDDLSGVAHGFLAAGAEQLIANQWRIREEATLSWIGAFYRAWTKRRDAAQAARLAGQETRRAWPHPYYWGGFIFYRRSL
jgi:CHAT domain-containing protein